MTYQAQVPKYRNRSFVGLSVPKNKATNNNGKDSENKVRTPGDGSSGDNKHCDFLLLGLGATSMEELSAILLLLSSSLFRPSEVHYYFRTEMFPSQTCADVQGKPKR